CGTDTACSFMTASPSIEATTCRASAAFCTSRPAGTGNPALRNIALTVASDNTPGGHCASSCLNSCQVVAVPACVVAGGWTRCNAHSAIFAKVPMHAEASLKTGTPCFLILE